MNTKLKAGLFATAAIPAMLFIGSPAQAQTNSTVDVGEVCSALTGEVVGQLRASSLSAIIPPVPEQFDNNELLATVGRAKLGCDGGGDASGDEANRLICNNLAVAPIRELAVQLGAKGEGLEQVNDANVAEAREVFACAVPVAAPAPVEEVPVEEVPAEEAPVEEPATEIPVEEAPADPEGDGVVEAPAGEEGVIDAPAGEIREGVGPEDCDTANTSTPMTQAEWIEFCAEAEMDRQGAGNHVADEGFESVPNTDRGVDTGGR